jgi:hypothetical protein
MKNNNTVITFHQKSALNIRIRTRGQIVPGAATLFYTDAENTVLYCIVVWRAKK